MLVGWLVLAGVPVVFDVDVGCADVVGESLGELLLFSCSLGCEFSLRVVLLTVVFVLPLVFPREPGTKSSSSSSTQAAQPQKIGRAHV